MWIAQQGQTFLRNPPHAPVDTCYQTRFWLLCSVLSLPNTVFTRNTHQDVNIFRASDRGKSFHVKVFLKEASSEAIAGLEQEKSGPRVACLRQRFCHVLSTQKTQAQWKETFFAILRGSTLAIWSSKLQCLRWCVSTSIWEVPIDRASSFVRILMPSASHVSLSDLELSLLLKVSSPKRTSARG